MKYEILEQSKGFLHTNLLKREIDIRSPSITVEVDGKQITLFFRNKNKIDIYNQYDNPLQHFELDGIVYKFFLPAVMNGYSFVKGNTSDRYVVLYEFNPVTYESTYIKTHIQDQSPVYDYLLSVLDFLYKEAPVFKLYLKLAEQYNLEKKQFDTQTELIKLQTDIDLLNIKSADIETKLRQLRKTYEVVDSL